MAEFKRADEIVVAGKRCSDMSRDELLNAVEQVNYAVALAADRLVDNDHLRGALRAALARHDTCVEAG